MLGLVGEKLGMTRIFQDNGRSVPVTVIRVLPNYVTDIKTAEANGYAAIQITTGEKKASKVNKSEQGRAKKAGVEAGRGYWEFRLDQKAISEFSFGQEVSVDIFKEGQLVDVTGKSKGKGTAGCVKRWNFRTQDATHGNSLSHRAPGSIGQNQSPGRVFKGKKMAGRMGAVRKTLQSLEIVKIDKERQVLLIKGAVPGAPGSDVIIKPAVKADIAAA